MTSSPKSVLDVDDLAPGELGEVLDLAGDDNPPRALAGKGVALVFQKPSARTRNSSEMAVFQLGGHPVTMRDEELGIDARESAEDVARTLAQYHCALGARVKDHGTLRRMAAVSDVPVINLLSDVSHPLQAIADVLTLRQHWGGLEGLRVAWVGDSTNVARSLSLACAMVGAELAVASPEGYGLPLSTVARVAELGGKLTQTTLPEEAVRQAHAVFTDVWVSMGQEASSLERREALRPYQVNSELMSLAAPGAVFLHCLPAHRGEEVAHEVIDGPASLVWEEAANRLRAMRGLLLWMFSRR